MMVYLFFILYNIALGYTTAARASLALSTLPLQTMLGGGILGIEPLTMRKSVGVGIAVLGVFAALASGLSAAPSGAWRGELIMAAAVLCMAFYNVWSRAFIRRSSALGFLAVGMGAGAVALVVVGLLTGRVAVLESFGAPQWIAGIYLGIGGGACALGVDLDETARAFAGRVGDPRQRRLDQRPAGGAPGSEIRSEAQDRRHGAPHGEGDRGSGSGTAISAAMLVSRCEIRRPEPERLRGRLYPCARAFTTAAPKPGAPDFLGSVT